MRAFSLVVHLSTIGLFNLQQTMFKDLTNEATTMSNKTKGKDTSDRKTGKGGNKK